MIRSNQCRYIMSIDFSNVSMQSQYHICAAIVDMLEVFYRDIKSFKGSPVLIADPVQNFADYKNDVIIALFKQSKFSSFVTAVPAYHTAEQQKFNKQFTEEFVLKAVQSNFRIFSEISLIGVKDIKINIDAVHDYNYELRFVDFRPVGIDMLGIYNNTYNIAARLRTIIVCLKVINKLCDVTNFSVIHDLYVLLSKVKLIMANTAILIGGDTLKEYATNMHKENYEFIDTNMTMDPLPMCDFELQENTIHTDERPLLAELRDSITKYQ